ncbi:MAG: hypothetical protein CME36_20855 [unclassified Hahellaceae]|nr:hypothetical protein [Hahellaceae bacterium]|tara:strand:+ start:100137 stop:101207 length:1071 start_codon:yes stop_codon:yes gene_type:complete
MSVVSYTLTLCIVTFAWSQELVPARIVLEFIGFMSVFNATFFWLIHSNINLKFRDPSMTAVQMVVSLIPALWVVYALEDGQARAVFLLVGIVPALYGILALNTRQFLVVAVFYLLFYGITMFMLWLNGSMPLNPPLEVMQFIALALVTTQIAVIGGYINGLRGQLRKRNGELRVATTELAEALEKIGELASRDSLTGVFNRRHLLDVLSKEANRRKRSTGPFSLCIMDVDHFKKVNDEFGHKAGDDVLREVALVTSRDLRGIDCFGRYGGEEFLLILPQTPLEGARIKAERVRQGIENLRFPDIGPDFRITVSIGLAEHRDSEDVDATIHRADMALYRAKHEGRNRTIGEDSLQSS